MSKHQKLTLILTLTLSLVFVVFTPRAQADIWSSLTSITLMATVGWVIQLAMQLIAIGIWAGGALFDLFLEWGNITNLPIITEGWKIIRDFVNVSFIFVLLTIAISTILGIEKFGVKKLFVNLVIMALLVNFSMVLVNVVLDTSNLVTNFFIEGSGVSDGAVSSKLAWSLGIAKVWETAQNSQGLAGVANATGTFLISMIMGTVILLATLIVIWLATGLLVVRAIILAFIAIFAPAAFLCRVIPGMEKYWQKWWSTLVGWALFTPAFAFFLYLAMRTADSFNDFKNSLDPAMVPNFEASISSFFSAGNNLIQYILVLGFTVGGLLMAKQFGVAGGAKAFAMGSNALKKATGYQYAKTKGGKYAKDQFKNLGQRVAGGIGRLGEGFQNLPKGLKYTAGLPAIAPAFLARQAGQTFGLKPGQILAQQRAEIAEEKKKLENFATPDLVKQLDSAHGANLAALMEELTKRGDLDDKHFKDSAGDIDTEKIKRILQSTEKAGGSIKDVLRHRPDWAVHAAAAKLKDYQGLTNDQALDKAAKAIKPEQASNISGDVTQNTATMQKLFDLMGAAHLENIGRNNIALMTQIQNQIDSGQFTLPPRLVTYINSQLGQGLGWHV